MAWKTTIGCLAVSGAACVLAACGGEQGGSAGDAGSAAAAWLLDDMPAGAQHVAEAKTTAAEGDTVVLEGRIGGRKSPMSADSPVFTIMDLSIPHCGDNPEDACTTPWDYCCETNELITANAATVQVVGAAGAALETGLTDAGLAPLDRVVVVGTVGARPSADVLTVRATGVHVVRD